MTTVDTFYLDAKGRTAINKDPGATLDYTFDWTEWLAAEGDLIASAAATCDGATVEGLPAVSFDAKSVTVWVSGGELGTRATLTVTITTDSTPARIEPVSVFLKITPKVT